MNMRFCDHNHHHGVHNTMIMTFHNDDDDATDEKRQAGKNARRRKGDAAEGTIRLARQPKIVLASPPPQAPAPALALLKS